MSCRRSNKQVRKTAKNIWQLANVGEPFRVLFPMGVVIGILGVMMWPLFVWNVIGRYPGMFHARIMIEGFLTCFVMGFLGTSMPRMLDAPRLRLPEALLYAGLLGLTVTLQFAGKMAAGDCVFLATMLLFCGGLIIRFLMRKDMPPPAFVLVGLGLFCALGGVTLQLVSEWGVGVPSRAVVLGRLMLNQGYMLLPVMGVGAFLLPRFFELPTRQNFPESASPPPGWISRALFALSCGLVVLAGFVLEASGEVRLGYGLRAAAVLVYFVREIPWHKAGFGGGTLALGLRIALISIPAGYALIAVWPDRAFSFLHIFFITGLSLLTLIVASRVVLGHSGQSKKFYAGITSVRVMVAFIVLAMVTRVSADWMPDIRMTHYAYAGISWAVGVLVWALFILPGVCRADTE